MPSCPVEVSLQMTVELFESITNQCSSSFCLVFLVYELGSNKLPTLPVALTTLPAIAITYRPCARTARLATKGQANSVSVHVMVFFAKCLREALRVRDARCIISSVQQLCAGLRCKMQVSEDHAVRRAMLPMGTRLV